MAEATIGEVVRTAMKDWVLRHNCVWPGASGALLVLVAKTPRLGGDGQCSVGRPASGAAEARELSGEGLLERSRLRVAQEEAAEKPDAVDGE